MSIKSMAALGALAFIAACSSVPNEDTKPELASGQGYYVSQDQAQDRGGISNYVPRSAAEKQQAGTVSSAAIDPDKEMLSSLEQKPETFFFDTNDYNLSQKDVSRLDKIATAMKTDPTAKLNIRGYTDAQGDLDHNKQLSVNRSSSVASYLEGKGVPAGQIKAEGMGPVANNDARAENPDDRVVKVQAQFG